MTYSVTTSVTIPQGVVTPACISRVTAPCHAEWVDISGVRRANFRELLRKRHEGNQSAFAEELGYPSNLVNRYVHGRKKIGDKVARHIESKTRTEKHWMDHDHSNVESLELHRIKQSLSAPALAVAQKWEMLADERSRQTVVAMLDSLLALQKGPKGSSPGRRKSG